MTRLESVLLRGATRAVPALCCLTLVAAPLAAQDAGQPPSSSSRAVGDPQEPADPRRSEGDVDRVIVTATRESTTEFDAPFSTSLVTSELFQMRGYRTVNQALRDVPGIMVQETSVSQGSPYLRGFTGYQNVLLIDGIRLNNSVFRSGPNQYWATVNSLSLDRLEVVKGPSSVLYGSDAIGGTVQAFTKEPWTTGVGFTHGGSVLVRYATADASLWGRGELSFGQRWDDGSQTSVLVGGDKKYFGDRVAGDPSGRLPYTGYEEGNFDLKLIHRFDPHTRLVFAHQSIRQEDAPRTHRTVQSVPWRGTTVGSDLVREFDQRRQLTYGQVHAEQLGGIVDSIRASVSLQTQSEVRDRVRGNGNSESQGFDVDTYGAWVQLGSESPVGRLTYGAEWYHDEVDSFSSTNAIQGPVGDDSTYDIAALYLQDRVELSEDLEAIAGARFSYVAADVGRYEDPATGNPASLDDDWSDLVFSIRLRYELIGDQLAVYGGASQGFRAPNLSDLTRLDSARTDEFEVPNPNLDSERYVTYEVGFKGRAGDRAAYDVAGYYTDIRDQINRFPTGNTFPSGEREITKDNVGDGYVWGLEFAGSYRVLDGTTVFGALTYTDGEVDNFETLGGTIGREYLTRLMPLTVHAGVRWEEVEQGRFWAETMVRWADDADRLSSSDMRDTSRIPPGGTPGYTVWDAGAGWRIEDDTTLNARLENITDIDYRVHGSGTNMPGRNLVLLVESRF